MNNQEVSQELLGFIEGLNAQGLTFIDKKGRFLIKIECLYEDLDYTISEELDYGRFKYKFENIDSKDLRNFLINFNKKNSEYISKDTRNIDNLLKGAPSKRAVDWDKREMELIFPGQIENNCNLIFDKPTKVIYYGVSTNQIEEDLLLQKDKPFFPNSLNAFRHYMKMPHSPFLSGILFTLPMTKNFFSEVSLSDHILYFKLKYPEKINEDFNLCIYYTNEDSSDSVTIPFTQSYTLKIKPNFLDIVLVDKDFNILDRRKWENKEGFEKHQFSVNYEYSKPEIDDILDNGETPKIELKGFTDLCNLTDHQKKDIMETIVSFANSKGGSILFGAKERNNEWKIVDGFTDTKVIAEIRDQIKKLIAAHCSPYTDFFCMLNKYENTKVLIVEIPEGSEKPYEYNFVKAGEKKYFIRRDTSDDQATREELIALCNRNYNIYEIIR